LDDDEYVTAILRHAAGDSTDAPKMTAHLKSKRETEEKLAADEKMADDTAAADNDKAVADETPAAEKETDGENTNKTEEESGDDPSRSSRQRRVLLRMEEEYMASLRYNVNVFLPMLRSLEGIDDGAVEQLKLDEQHVRDAAIYLWDVLLPKITLEMKQGDGHQLPLDGKSMVEFLHQSGINCRYMGRLATLAAQEEAKDLEELVAAKAGKAKTVSRRVMPLSWLELLEVEMICSCFQACIGFLLERSRRSENSNHCIVS
jgi:protein TIF31